jgi:hypothetical protein
MDGSGDVIFGGLIHGDGGGLSNIQTSGSLANLVVSNTVTSTYLVGKGATVSVDQQANFLWDQGTDGPIKYAFQICDNGLLFDPPSIDFRGYSSQAPLALGVISRNFSILTDGKTAAPLFHLELVSSNATVATGVGFGFRPSDGNFILNTHLNTNFNDTNQDYTGIQTITPISIPMDGSGDVIFGGLIHGDGGLLSNVQINEGDFYKPPFKTIESSRIISPTKIIHFISGTAVIQTITPPPPVDTNGGTITFIPLDYFDTSDSGGNIALRSSAVKYKALIMTYDPIQATWYPSY